MQLSLPSSEIILNECSYNKCIFIKKAHTILLRKLVPIVLKSSLLNNNLIDFFVVTRQISV